MADKHEQPVIAGLRSIKRVMDPGIYYWCACGRSANQPFCDGSHQGSSFQPVEVKITEKKLIKWCSCKQTEMPPYCDNAHRDLPGYTPKPGK